jgi:hypothetical protein
LLLLITTLGVSHSPYRHLEVEVLLRKGAWATAGTAATAPAAAAAAATAATAAAAPATAAAAGLCTIVSVHTRVRHLPGELEEHLWERRIPHHADDGRREA